MRLYLGRVESGRSFLQIPVLPQTKLHHFSWYLIGWRRSDVQNPVPILKLSHLAVLKKKKLTNKYFHLPEICCVWGDVQTPPDTAPDGSIPPTLAKSLKGS